MSATHMQNAAVQAAGLSLSQLEASKYVLFASDPYCDFGVAGEA
jgi:hypothetical protein